MSVSTGPIIVPCCSSLYGSLYSHATLSTITSDWLWHPADISRDHLRKLCSLKLSCEPGGIRSAQTAVPSHIITLVLSLALLWVHSVCCSGQWGVGATQSSNSHSPPAPPTHPPIVTAICAGTMLLGRGHGWRNPLQIVWVWTVGFVCNEGGSTMS